MEERSRKQTNRYGGVAAVLAFVTQPVPALDELIVVPVHYWFTLRFAQRRHAKVLRLPWKNIQKIIWYGAGARLVANFSLGLVPIVGMFSNAITALALTEYLGRYLDDAVSDPSAVPPDISMDTLKQLFADALKKKTPGAAGANGASAEQAR